MITSWAEVLRTCLHGVKEGVDSHDCPQCREIAEQLMLPLDNDQTYIFLSEEHVRQCKIRRIELAREKGLLKV